jgi:hypothetical protein
MRLRRPLLAAAVLATATATATADPLRDPTRPPQLAGAHAAPQEQAPVLSAVFTAGARRSAIVNGRLVRAGDTVGAFTIEDILVDGVRYRRAGSVRDLHLPHAADTVKKPAAGPARAAIGGP